MKSVLFLFLLFCNLLVGSDLCMAQRIRADSVLSIVVAQINKSEGRSYRTCDYGSYFYVEDVATKAPVEKQSYGIYEFGLFGDDLSRWIMWYDPSGYKIFNHGLDMEMLGEMFEFFERNNCSELQSFYYIKGLYEASCRIENTGERELDE